ncbi:hypothetical protein K440DRAFT_627880 [Wilcoxina mikolae CBS 423.85]|nr:hypothetical protein K440DRAFT_627880 [Wilcoxina mikolae CBS 423.85]
MLDVFDVRLSVRLNWAKRSEHAAGYSDSSSTNSRIYAQEEEDDVRMRKEGNIRSPTQSSSQSKRPVSLVHASSLSKLTLL